MQSIHRQFWAIALPMMLSSMSLPLVVFVDHYLIGHLSHSRYLASFVLASSIYVFIAGAFNFLRMGITGLVAQSVGAKNLKRSIQIFWQGMLLALAISLLGLIIMQLIARVPIFWHWIQWQAFAADYLSIRSIGLFALLPSYVLIGWLLAQSNVRIPLVMLFSTNLINIVLSVIAVKWTQQVEWVISAAVVAEFVGLALGFYLTLRQYRYLYSKSLHLFNLRQLAWRELMQANTQLFFRSLILQSLFLWVNLQSAVYGAATVAANALLLNSLMLISFSFDGLAHAVESIAGRAIGAKQWDLVKQTLKVALLWTSVLAILFFLFFLLFGQMFIRLQTDLTDVIVVADQYLIFMVFLPILAAWSYLYDGFCVASQQFLVMRNSVLYALIAAIIVFGLLYRWQNTALWLALVCFMLVRSGYLYLKIRQWQRNFLL